ncbi:MAG: hypothetical protein WDW36_007523 [Sanguina aurantia]
MRCSTRVAYCQAERSLADARLEAEDADTRAEDAEARLRDTRIRLEDAESAVDRLDMAVAQLQQDLNDAEEDRYQLQLALRAAQALSKSGSDPDLSRKLQQMEAALRQATHDYRMLLQEVGKIKDAGAGRESALREAVDEGAKGRAALREAHERAAKLAAALADCEAGRQRGSSGEERPTSAISRRLNEARVSDNVYSDFYNPPKRKPERERHLPPPQ